MYYMCSCHSPPPPPPPPPTHTHIDRKDSCANFSCPAGSVCRTFEGEPFCDPSCDLQNGGCPEYTVCRLQTVFCIRAPCPPQVVCDPVITETPPTCQPPQEVSRCPIPSCLGPTCTPLLPSSIYRCCSPGHRCAVFQPTRETFCDPSCDLDNGGCPEGTVCRLNQVQCVRAPCPPVIECVNTSGVCVCVCVCVLREDFPYASVVCVCGYNGRGYTTTTCTMHMIASS